MQVAQGKVKEDAGSDAMQQLALETVAASEEIGMGSSGDREAPEGAARAASASAQPTKSSKRPAEGSAAPHKKEKKSKQRASS